MSKRPPSPRRSTGQLDSVLDWLVANRHDRYWLAEKFGHRRDWSSKLFHGEIACSVPVLVRIAKITGLPLELLAGECIK